MQIEHRRSAGLDWFIYDSPVGQIAELDSLLPQICTSLTADYRDDRDRTLRLPGLRRVDQADGASADPDRLHPRPYATRQGPDDVLGAAGGDVDALGGDG